MQVSDLLPQTLPNIAIKRHKNQDETTVSFALIDKKTASSDSIDFCDFFQLHSYQDIEWNVASHRTLCVCHKIELNSHKNYAFIEHPRILNHIRWLNDSMNSTSIQQLKIIFFTFSIQLSLYLWDMNVLAKKFLVSSSSISRKFAVYFYRFSWVWVEYISKYRIQEKNAHAVHNVSGEETEIWWRIHLAAHESHSRKLKCKWGRDKIWVEVKWISTYHSKIFMTFRDVRVKHRQHLRVVNGVISMHSAEMSINEIQPIKGTIARTFHIRLVCFVV